MAKHGQEQGAEEKAVSQNEIPYIQNKRAMLYLAPSNEILEQTKNRIIENIHGKVGTVGKTKDEIIAEVFPNIKFATYPSLLARSGKSIIEGSYDFIVLDELHRTGAEKWEKKLDKLLENQTEETKVLGITATPTRDVDERNMADELALKLGYTEEEVEAQKHIAINMDLVEAIKLGLVVNPKLVSCEYMLQNDGSMENLLESINSITDENTRKEKLAQYEKLRRSLENAKGVPEILQSNIKQGGKYIVFIPVTDQGEIEDEDGNKIGKKTGENKIKEYEAYLQKCLEGSNITPEYYSMLGSYTDKKNLQELEQFENDDSEQTKFMIVMNKANEGLHIKGADGIVWLRALDENSKILYLQQLGRIIYAEDPNNPTKEEDRPVIIDLSNNTAKVDINKDIKNNSGRDDLQLLTIIVDWVNMHQMLPSIESTSNQEKRYAATLYRIQNKYMKYLDEANLPEDLEEKRPQIEAILNLGAEIDLWNIELPPITQEQTDKILNVQDFEVKGILKDFCELENEVEIENEKTAVERFIEELKKLHELGIDGSMIKSYDTIQTLCERNKISIEQAKKAGLKLENNIGYTKSDIQSTYRGVKERVILKKEQVEIMRELGVELERKNRTSEEIYSAFIEQLQKLKQLGIDGSMIKKRDNIKTLCERHGIGEEEIKNVGLTLEDNIGKDKITIISIDRGNRRGKRMEEEQKAKMIECGINFEVKKKTSEERISEFTEQLQKLKQLGINGSMIKTGDTIKALCDRNQISREEAQKIGLELENEIGMTMNIIIDICRGTRKGKKPKEEQLKIMKEYGVSFEKKTRTSEERNSEFIEQLQKLKQLGINGSIIKTGDTIKTLCDRNQISREEAKNIGLNLEYKIGQDKQEIQKIYRSARKETIPPEQVAIMRELGVNFEYQRKRKTAQDIGKATFDAPVEGCDQAQAVLDKLVQREQEKEGGKTQNE